MNHEKTGTAGCRSRAGWVAVAGLAVCAVAISGRSYWIDEAGVAWKSTLPTLRDLWRTLAAEGSGNLQLPFYHLFAWFWEKGAGINELALRWCNAPWFLAGLVILARAFEFNPPLRRGLLLAALSSPFVWYYLDEARPYALQVGASLIVFAALCRLASGRDEPAREGRWMTVLCFGSVVLAASGLLAMLWLGAYLGGALLSTPWRRWRDLARRFWLQTAIGAALLAGVGLFYLWTLSIGARATIVANGTDFRNLPFILFELMGFSGLGPGRLAIRAGGGLGVFRPWLPGLALYGALTLAVLAAGRRGLPATISRRAGICWAAAFLAVAGFIIAVGIRVHFRVLGRHCAPVLPLVLFGLGAGLGRLLGRDSGWWRRAIGIGFVGLSVISSLTLRFSERHAKDDYRSAAALGRESLARGETVWWNADAEAAHVYRLPISDPPGAARMALFLMEPEEGFARDLARPDLILASKPDVYDNHGALAVYLAQNGYRAATNFTAFTAWRRGPSGTGP